MINSILNGLLSFVFGIVSLLLAPIDALINSNFPSISELLTSFGGFIDKILEVIPWILSWFHIPQTFLLFATGYLVWKLTSSIVIHEVKIVLAWYRKIMP